MKSWKNILCGVIAGTMLLAAPVWAAEAVPETASETVSETAAQGAVAESDTKCIIETNNIPPWPKAADIMAETGILMDADTGVVLFDKGADEKRYPASITKVMTLLIAVENGNLDDVVTFTETGIRDIAPDSGNIGMQLGETMTLRECIFAMILNSANEVSTQIAEYIGGTEQHFIEMMNARAKEIGCKNTNFVNANGLPDPNQYTTARDMAMIYRTGMRNKTFRRVMNKHTYTAQPTNLNPQPRQFVTHHPLFSQQSSIYNPDCIGGKSGRTDAAASTLVTAMKKNGITYIAVVLKDADINQSGVDTQQIFDYGYNNFQKVAVNGGSVIIPNGMSVSDLYVKEKEMNGKIRQNYYLEGHYVGRGMVAKADPAAEPAAQEEAPAPENAEVTEGEVPIKAQIQDQKENGLSQTAKMLLGVGAVMVVILIVLCILLAVKDHKSARRYEEDDNGEFY